MKWTSFLKNQKLPKPTQDEINNLHSFITIMSNWIHSHKPSKNQISLVKSTNYLKKKSILHNVFQKIEEEFVCEGILSQGLGFIWLFF